jgi:plastocyanin
LPETTPPSTCSTQAPPNFFDVFVVDIIERGIHGVATAAAVNGSAVGNTVLLGRTSATSAESTVSQNAMYPQNLVVAVGTLVTFVNPASSVNNHCAYSFFEHAFDTGVLMPGQAFSFAFNTPGEYHYNDCVWPQTTGKIVVQ